MAQYTRVSGIVGLITLQNPPVNALSAAVRQGIVDKVETALSDPKVKSVVICGQNGNFCGVVTEARESGARDTDWQCDREVCRPQQTHTACARGKAAEPPAQSSLTL